MGKIFRAPMSERWLLFLQYKELIQLNKKNTKTSISKWVKDRNNFMKEEV